MIRLARPDEYDAAGQLTADAYSANYSDLSPEYLASMRDVATRVAQGDVWVAEGADGELLGSVWVPREGETLSHLAQDGELDFRQLAVSPHARGRGIGEALTRHVIALGHSRGATRVVMNSGPQMTSAHALYTKMGFRRLPEREGRIEVQPGRWIDVLAFAFDL